MQVVIPEKNVGYILSRGFLDKKSGALLRDNNKLAIIVSTIEKGQQIGDDVNEIINQIEHGLVPNSSSKIQKNQLDFISKLLRQCVSSNIGLTILTALCRDIAPLCNAAVEKIPSKEFLREARKIAEDDLQKHGDTAIETIISNWDDFTYTSCLTKENDIGRDLMNRLSSNLQKYGGSINSETIEHLISGSMQEFERRAGQKRKSRAGDDLQQSVEVIMNHLGVNLDPIPQHLTGILEADHVIKDKGHMCIVSCKRTGRERVKQVSVELQELQRHRIRKIIWFFTDFDQSENRVEDLGVRGSIFYLPDSSHDYERFSKNQITSPYIFPISKIRHSLPKLLRGHV